MSASMSLSYHWLNAPAVDEQSNTANETRKISREDKSDVGETAIPAKVQAMIKKPNLTLAAK
jgi:hypothetical protein